MTGGLRSVEVSGPHHRTRLKALETGGVVSRVAPTYPPSWRPSLVYASALLRRCTQSDRGGEKNALDIH